MPINSRAASLDADALVPIRSRACLHFAGRKGRRVKNGIVDKAIRVFKAEFEPVPTGFPQSSGPTAQLFALINQLVDFGQVLSPAKIVTLFVPSISQREAPRCDAQRPSRVMFRRSILKAGNAARLLPNSVLRSSRQCI
jgi:hypothetical protein